MKLLKNIFLFYVLNNVIFSFTNHIDLRKALYKNGKIKKALFTSKDDITSTIISLIENEQESIKMCMYMVTSKRIAQSLINAKSKGKEVEIITDYNCHRDEFSKISLLQKNNITVDTFGYKGKDGYNQALMHHKFFLFKKNIDNKKICCSGSFNCTKNAQKNNKDNLLIIEDEEIYNDYEKEFELIKTQCHKRKEKKGKSIVNKNFSKLSNSFSRSFKIKK